jgi:hypothetical protein
VPSRCQIRPLGQRVAVPMSSAKTNAQLSNAVLGTMPVPTNATLKTTSRIVAAPPSTKAPSTTELSETLKTVATPAFINESNFMADLCKAKLRVPRQLVRLLRDGAFQAGNAPYARSALLCQRAPARVNVAFGNVVFGNTPFVMSATSKITLCIFAVTRSVINWLRTLKTGHTHAFIKESDFMADMCRAKLRVPRQLAPVRRDGAFQGGNAPYARSALLANILPTPAQERVT